MSVSEMVLSYWSGDELGVRTPVLLAVVVLVLLTRGKLRFVPVESKEATEGRWVMDMGRRTADDMRRLEGGPWPSSSHSSGMDEMPSSPSLAIMLERERWLKFTAVALRGR